MDRRAVRSWVMYDWANSAYATTMMAAVLPIYYESVAGSGLEGNLPEVIWGYTQTIAMLIVAVLSPILGAIADHLGAKVKFLAVFAVLGSAASACMALAGSGDWLLASILVILGTIGFSTGNTFYDAMLPDLVPREHRERISARGYAMGYIGGGLLLAINLVMIEGWRQMGFPDKTTATQTVFLTVGVWWLLFALPLLRRVRDARGSAAGSAGSAVLSGARRIIRTFRGVRGYPELLKYMLSFWFFNDGINTIILMATIYGAGIGIGTTHLIAALLITQFVAFPSTLLFGRYAVRAGAKRALYVSLGIYVAIVVLGYFMSSAAHFYALAVMVGLVQGGSQAVARSLYANLVPPSRSAEFFGFLSLSSKFSSVAGPFVFSTVGALTGSSRLAILSLIAFFLLGIYFLTRVDLDKGRREALAGEEPAA